MITLLSPSKKLNFKHQDAVSAFTQCDFIESAQELLIKQEFDVTRFKRFNENQ